MYYMRKTEHKDYIQLSNTQYISKEIINKIN